MAHPLALRKEKDVLREILLYLRARGVFHFRINNTGTFDPGRKIFLKPHNLTPGVADVIVLRAGKMICLEAKSPTGKQSPEQKQFGQNVKAAGGEYYLVRCVQDVLNAGI
jgi:hypothetical protein